MVKLVKQYGYLILGFVVLLLGGEIMVIVNNIQSGKGGCNIEFLFSLVCVFQGEYGIWVMVGDSDGIDGIEDVVGVIVFLDMFVCGKLSGFNVV